MTRFFFLISGLWDCGAAVAQQTGSDSRGYGRRRQTWPVVLFFNLLYRIFSFFRVSPKRGGGKNRGRTGRGLLAARMLPRRRCCRAMPPVRRSTSHAPRDNRRLFAFWVASHGPLARDAARRTRREGALFLRTHEPGAAPAAGVAMQRSVPLCVVFLSFLASAAAPLASGPGVRRHRRLRPSRGRLSRRAIDARAKGKYGPPARSICLGPSSSSVPYSALPLWQPRDR